MKKMIILALATCLVCGMMAGCGVSQADYDKVVSENKELKASLETTQTYLSQEQDTNSRLQEKIWILDPTVSSGSASSTSSSIKKII